MAGVVLHLPEDESVVLSGPVASRLLERGDGDAALLYIAVLQLHGSGDEGRLRSRLGWGEERFRRAAGVLSAMGLLAQPVGDLPAQRPPEPPQRPEKPEYTRADMARALEGKEFSSLTAAVEDKLGKKLTTPDIGVLLGLYDDLGLPADVIFLLVGFCSERIVQQYGPGRRPTLRQIEREGYTWARLGLMTQESAAAYIKKYQRSRQALPRLMRLLRLGDRPASPSEEKYLLAWNDMGFSDGVIELAYDKTVMKCKELKWPYMNKILQSWHQKGFHTLEQVKEGDRPARKAPRQEENPSPRADMDRMERYLQQLRQESKEKEGT